MKWLFDTRFLSALAIVMFAGCAADDTTSNEQGALGPDNGSPSAPNAPPAARRHGVLHRIYGRRFRWKSRYRAARDLLLQRRSRLVVDLAAHGLLRADPHHHGDAEAHAAGAVQHRLRQPGEPARRDGHGL